MGNDIRIAFELCEGFLIVELEILQKNSPLQILDFDDESVKAFTRKPLRRLYE